MSRPTDSQLTLVEPSIVAPVENIILVFDKDDMKNTTIRIRGDVRPSYVVRTMDSKKTTVHAGDLLIATVERKTLRPDSITFKDSSRMNLADWLKAPRLSSFPLSFEERGRRLEWRADFISQLALYDLGDSGSEPVAWFAKSRRQAVNGRRVIREAFLGIKPEYEDVRDAIVVSCLLAEHKIRVKAQDAALGNRGPASM